MEEKRICNVCGVEKPIISFGRYYNHVSSNLRRHICEQCRKNRQYHNLRFLFLKHFNFKCQCCGITEIRFLTLDHVQNDGHKDGHLTPIQLYRKAFEDKFDSERWNCLCWNCNCARSQNRGICPHKDTVTEQVFLERYTKRASYKEDLEIARKVKTSKTFEDLSELITKMSPENTKKLLEVLQARTALSNDSK